MKSNDRRAGQILGACVLTLLFAVACSDQKPDGTQAAAGRRGGRPGGSGGPGGFPGAASAAAVPVESAPVERRAISSFIESNGVLEAENEVDVVARISGPIVRLAVEEGDFVRSGQLLARIDPAEITAQLEVSRVALADAKLAYERAVRLREDQLISPEDYEVAAARYETAKAQLQGNQIQLGYTEVQAPFAGLITERHINFAQQVGPGTPLFKLSDFTPLLVPIQVPERELSRLEVGQPAHLTVEAWPDREFKAGVLRIRPVVDAATGTVRVSLEVDSEGKLSPGMFARVFVQTETHQNALVVPKSALSLESIGDTVYVVGDGLASRREVELGFEEGDFVEVLSGVAEGEAIVVVGQDGLSDGTPIQVLTGPGASPGPSETAPATARTAQTGQPSTGSSPAASGDGEGGPGRPGSGGPGMRGGFDPSQMTGEQLEAIKKRMRERGLSEKEIEERLQRMRQRAAQGG